MLKITDRFEVSAYDTKNHTADCGFQFEQYPFECTCGYSKEHLMSQQGHNSANHQLLSFVERIERLAEERKGITSDITEVFAEAKANGFDPKVMRKVISLRAMDQAEREEMEALMTTYEAALDGAELNAREASEDDGA